MNQKAQISTQSNILSALSFPDKGDIVSGVKIIDTDTKILDGNFRYRITLPKGTRRSDIPNILGSFYKTQMINIDGIDHVVQEHDYQTKPTRNSTVVSGSMVLTPLSKTNPMQKKLTALEDFDQEYTKMEMVSPESYFNIYPYRGFNGPTFRNKLWSFVSTRGENYGYTDGKKMYYRRASLVMPKIKITKAPSNANMFYHTHPKKDEPSLSSPDDYLLYFDMSHKPLNIRHFYTVMADRMDHFHIVPKHSKKKDYVRISEDKFIEELDHQIDEAGKRLDETMPNDTYQDDLHYCEKVTREVVKWLNKKYEKYFTITYKCYYKVKKNPDKPTGSDLHLDDELIAKPLNDIKSGKYSWPEFQTKEKPHEEYAYWHSRYFSQNRNMGGTGYMGLIPGEMRRLEHFLYSQYRGSNYTYDDILGILCLSYDIRVRDSKITDGKEFETRIEDILDYLEIKDKTIREDIIMFDSIAAVDVYGENIAEMIGDHYFILPLAHFSFKSVEAMKDVRAGKRNFERAKYDIMVTEREKMARVLAEALRTLNRQIGKDIRAEEPDPETGEYEIIKPAEKVPVWGLDGMVMKDRINPPIQVAKIEYNAFLPTEIFENPVLIKEILEEWRKPGKELLGVKNKFNIVVPHKETAVGMLISISTGHVQFFYPAADYVATEPQEEAVVATFRQLVEKLNSRGFEIPTEDISIGEIEPMRNPKHGLLVSVSGIVSPSKNKIIDSLAKRLDANVATMYTTRALKEYEKKPSLVEVTDEVFDKMELNGDIVVVTLSPADASKRGYSRKELFSEGTTIVDTELADIPFLIKSEPSVKSFYLHPTNTKAAVKDFMFKYVSPQEAIRISETAALGKIMVEAEVDHVIEYDIDKPGEAIEEIYVEIPKKNPGPIGSLFIPSGGSDYYLRAQTIPISALQNVRRNSPIRDVPGVTIGVDDPTFRKWVGKQDQVGTAKSEYGHKFDGTISTGRRGGMTREILELTTKSNYFRKKYTEFVELSKKRGWKPAIKEVLESIPWRTWKSKEWGVAGRIVTIDEIQTANGGVCRHFATFGGLMVEEAIKKGHMKAKVYYVRGEGHGWLVIQSTNSGKVYIIDRAQDTYEEMTRDLKYYAGLDKEKNEIYLPYSEDVYKEVPEIAPLAQQNPPDGIVEKAIKSIKKTNLMGYGAFGTVFRIPDTGYVFKIYRTVDPEYYKELHAWIAKNEPKPNYPSHVKAGYKLNWGKKLDIGLPIYAIGEVVEEGYPEKYNIIMEEIEGYTIASKISTFGGKQHGKKFKMLNEHLKDLVNIPQSEYDRFASDYKEAVKLGMWADPHNGNMVLDPTKQRIVWLDFFWEKDESKTFKERKESQRIPIFSFEALAGINDWLNLNGLLSRSVKGLKAAPQGKLFAKTKRLKTKSSIKEAIPIHLESKELIMKVHKKFKKAMVKSNLAWGGGSRFHLLIEDKSYDVVLESELNVSKLVMRFHEGDKSGPKEFKEDIPQRVVPMEQLEVGYMPNPGWRHGEQMENDPFEDENWED